MTCHKNQVGALLLLVNIIGLLMFLELQFYFQEIAKHPMEIYFNFVVLNLF